MTAATILFDDEFNSLSTYNSSTRTGIWSTRYDWGPDTIINNEQEYYVDIANDGTSKSGGYNPFSVLEGKLTISAQPATKGTSNGQQFDSGVITTQHSFSSTYGYFEMRAQLPAGVGTWPAFWMDQDSLVWPPELDIMEEIGQEPNQYVGTVHTGSQNTMEQVYANTPNLAAQYHVYAVDWNAQTITWYMDNQKVGQVATPADMHSPMYMLINLAIGGSWPGPAVNVGQFPAAYKIDYVRVWNQKPDPLQDGLALRPVAESMTQQDTLTMRVSENAYRGDAQFTVSVDGQQVGGILTATALHYEDDSNVFTLTGKWGQGAHNVRIEFLNDAYGGTASTDRNLYVDSIAYGGITYAGANAALMKNSTKDFTVGSPTATVAGPADTLTLHLAEDAWNGDAKVVLSIDGKTITTAQAVVASHNAGAWQDLTFSGNFGSGSHDVGVTFTNDAWGGSGSTDRNLYVNGVDFNGTHYGSGTTALYSNGIAHFTV